MDLRIARAQCGSDPVLVAIAQRKGERGALNPRDRDLWAHSAGQQQR